MKPHKTGAEGAEISNVGGAIRKNLKEEKIRNSRVPLVGIDWEEGERRKAQEHEEEEKRLQEQRKLQEIRGDQWYLPKELGPVKGDNFSVLRTLQEQSGSKTKAMLDSTKPTAQIISSAPPLPADKTKSASGNVEGLEQFQASAPSQTADDTQCSLPSYDEVINII